jgi:hypothetical protein
MQVTTSSVLNHVMSCLLQSLTTTQCFGVFFNSLRKNLVTRNAAAANFRDFTTRGARPAPVNDQLVLGCSNENHS